MADAEFVGNTESVLVTDFDGTMTQHDFYKLAIERLIPPETPDYWSQYRAGEITHFEALRRYFASIRGSRNEVLAVVGQMQLDPKLPLAIDELKANGWQVVVTSAGCAWYIRELLSQARVDVTVHANPGRFEEGKGLLMEMPLDSPYLSQNLGVDKTAVVRSFLELGARVAFAGDGFPDVEPARLVPENLRFARADLAHVLDQDGLKYRGFRTWSDLPRMLLS